MGWIVGVDVGGTFTDFYAVETESGRACVHKTPSSPDNPARSIVEGLMTLTREEGIALPAIERIEHGTTVGTNALLERKGATVALITTAGFRDLLEIGRQVRPDMYDLQKDFPTPLVVRDRRIEVAERIMADGTVRQAAAPADIAAAVERVATSGAEACAVCLLFSFVNPVHEQAIRAALAGLAPHLFISLSSEVQPEFREYERMSTTVLNAYLQPVMARYLAHLEAELHRTVPGAAIGINQSSGGLMSVAQARQFPIRTALSGPAGGAVGAVHVARLAQRPNVITIDMGGTSADVCLIRDYATEISFDRSIAEFPVRLPVIDINTVGAGGGSIAWFGPDGLLKVGPASAGAAPGPSCYLKGGDNPTVTDANLVLGRLSTRGLLGGRMPLDLAAARRSFAAIAERLGYSVERVARGVIDIVVSNMVRAINTISVERGHDPRQFALLPFGGAGPLHAADVARSLGIREVVVPPLPGILCAQGIVVSDLRENFVRTGRTRVEEGCTEKLRSHLSALVAETERWFAAERVAPADRRLQASLDMRYVGQNFELPVELPDFALDALPTPDRLRSLFFEAHEAKYGYHNPEDPAEIVNYRISAFGRLKHQRDPVPAGPATGGTPSPIGERPVAFAADTAIATPVYDRSLLPTGCTITGPAVIEQLDATTLVFPGDRLRVDPAGCLVIELA